MRVLNDEERGFALYEGIRKFLAEGVPTSSAFDYETKRSMVLSEAVGTAQFKADIKAFVEWGGAECTEHPYTSRLASEKYNRKRHRCFECWQSLKQLVEE